MFEWDWTLSIKFDKFNLESLLTFMILANHAQPQQDNKP